MTIKKQAYTWQHYVVDNQYVSSFYMVIDQRKPGFAIPVGRPLDNLQKVCTLVNWLNSVKVEDYPIEWWRDTIAQVRMLKDLKIINEQPPTEPNQETKIDPTTETKIQTKQEQQQRKDNPGFDGMIDPFNPDDQF